MNKKAFDIQFSECPALIKDFLNYYGSIKERANSTVQAYYRDLKIFFLYILEKQEVISKDENDYKSLNKLTLDIIKSITRDDVIQYLYYRKKEINNSPATRSHHLTVLRKYFNYMYSYKKVIDTNPLENISNPKKKKSLPKHLTLDESLKLLNSVNTNFTTRDYCILTFFLNCGFRLSELVSINVTDIRNNGEVKILGKGNKERVVFLNNACIKALKDYLSERSEIENLIDREALFVSRKTRKRLTPRAVEKIVSKCLVSAGLGNKGYSTHKLRHTAATLMYQNGTDVRALQEVLGHSSLETTQIYTHVANEQVKDAVKNNPLADV